MDGNGGQGFGGGFFPIILSQQQQGPRGRSSSPDEKPPARVLVAMDFLHSLVIKSLPRAAVNDLNIEIIPPVPLSDEEEAAKATACSLLTKYFSGQLTPSLWEKTELDERKEDVSRGGEAGSIINCPACLAKSYTVPDCQFCSGRGKVIIRPV